MFTVRHKNWAVQEKANILGLGKKLIAHSESIAKKHGYVRLRVISAVGTRGYYRERGFSDGELYQEKVL